MKQVIDKLLALGGTGVRELEGATEKVTFPLPKALVGAA